MINYQDYRAFDGKKLSFGDENFTLKFDEERRCFRLYQKSKSRLHFYTDFSHEINHALNSSESLPNKYLKRIGQAFPRSDYLLIDAKTLDSFFTKGLLQSSEIKLDKLRLLRGKEELEEVQLQADGLAFDGRRIWINKDNCYKTCISDERETYVMSATSDADDVKTFKSYLAGENAIRVKSSPPVPLFVYWPFRTFKMIEENIPAPQKQNYEGGDDVGFAVTASKHPLEAPFAAQALAIFPLFLLAAKAGFDAIKDEANEQAKELSAINEEIINCQKIVDNFLQQKEFTGDNIKACLEALEKLNEALEKFKEVNFRSKTAAVLGLPGMITMLAALTTYQTQSLIGMMIGKSGPLFENGSTIKLHAEDGITHSATEGGFSTAGSGLLIGGELIMICFVLSKIYLQLGEYSKTRHELKEVEESKHISEVAKKIISSIKEDENFLTLVTIIGNSTLVAGQVLGLSPVPYAGLILSIIGVTTAVGAETLKEKRHDFAKQTSEIEDKINEHYLEELVKEMLKLAPLAQTESSTESSDLEFYTTVIEEKTFANEVLMHLASANLASHKILSEAIKENDYEKGLEKAKAHYKSHSHQQHLLSSALQIGHDRALKLEDYFEEAKKKGSFAGEIFYEKVMQALELKEGDQAWIIALSAKLRKFHKLSHEQLNFGDVVIHRETPRSLIEEMALIADLPQKIKENFKELLAENPSAIDYGQLVEAFKIGFVQSRLGNETLHQITTEILDDTNVENKAKKEKEFRDIVLGSSRKTAFLLESAQVQYVEENRFKGWYGGGAKKSGKYNPESEDNKNSAIKIVGQIIKKTGGLFTSTSHKKNVYAIDSEKIIPVRDEVLKEMRQLMKFFVKSQMYRSAEMVAKSGSEMENAKTVAKKIRPSGDATHETATKLERQSFHETSV